MFTKILQMPSAVIERFSSYRHLIELTKNETDYNVIIKSVAAQQFLPLSPVF
jgi:hypothetical protein